MGMVEEWNGGIQCSAWNGGIVKWWNTVLVLDWIGT